MKMTLSLVIILLGYPLIVISIDNNPVELEITRHPVTKLKSWVINKPPFKFELAQRLPDQNRALMQARGFSETVSDLIARQCIFKTVIQNTGGSSSTSRIVIDLLKWKIKFKDKTLKLKTREYWVETFLKKHKHTPASGLALKWGLYPTVNTLLPADYNWGLSSYGLAPGSVFNLLVVWKTNDTTHQKLLRDIQCAPDVEKL